MRKWQRIEWVIIVRELREVGFPNLATLAMALRSSEPVPDDVKKFLIQQLENKRIGYLGSGRPTDAYQARLRAIAASLRQPGPVSPEIREFFIAVIDKGKFKHPGKGTPREGNAFDREIDNLNAQTIYDEELDKIKDGDVPYEAGSPKPRALERTQRVLLREQKLLKEEMKKWNPETVKKYGPNMKKGVAPDTLRKKIRTTRRKKTTKMSPKPA